MLRFGLLKTAATDCGFNRSMQHLNSNYRGEDVENEVQTEDLLADEGLADQVWEAWD